MTSAPDSRSLQDAGPCATPEPSEAAERPDRKGAEAMRFAIRRDLGLGIGFRYGLTRYVSRVITITFFDMRVFGVRWVPASGATILASTHQSVLDPWLLGVAHHRPNCYLAKESLFRVPFLGWLIRKYDAFPIHRESTAARKAIETCVRILEKGRALVFFPEGTRSPDGKLQTLKKGISLLAKRSAALVSPVLLRGTGSAWPRGSWWPRASRIEVRFGRPLEVEFRESSDAFTERLSSAYRRLAIEAGATEVLEAASRAGASTSRDGESRSSPFITAEASMPPGLAGVPSSIPCTTRFTDGSLPSGETRKENRPTWQRTHS